MSRLILLVPGLFDRASDPTHGSPADPPLPALELLLARAVPSPVENAPYERLVCELFGVRSSPEYDLPVAALTHLVDFEQGHDGLWMRADPVYLRPDLGKLLLFDTSAFKLALDEAQALLGEVNAAIGDPALRLAVGKEPTRWYLCLSDLPRLTTRPPGVALGEHIDPFVPTGPDRRWWHRFGNEIQMILHQTAVNHRREARGELPINSVWFWGAGRLPVLAKAAPAKVWASEALARGLAKRCGCELADAPADAGAVLAGLRTGEEILAVVHAGRGWDRAHGPDGRRERIAELEGAWFAPLLAALRRRQLEELILSTEGHRFVLTRKGLWRFWRMRRPISQYGGG